MRLRTNLPVRPERRRGTHLDFAPLRSIRTVLLVIGLVSSFPLLADSDLPPAYWANRQLPDPAQERKAQALMAELRCVVCQGQSIGDSDAEIAGDMRDLVRRRIAAGQSPGEVRRWLVERYGSWISYRPSSEPLAWPLWLAPVVLLAIGLLLVRRRIAWKRRP